jgi:hypothetical protein
MVELKYKILIREGHLPAAVQWRDSYFRLCRILVPNFACKTI